MNKESLNETINRFSVKSAEERAFIIVDRYLRLAGERSDKGETIPDSLNESFTEWLFAPENRQAKDRALKRMFLKIMNDVPIRC